LEFACDDDLEFDGQGFRGNSNSGTKVEGPTVQRVSCPQIPRDSLLIHSRDIINSDSSPSMASNSPVLRCNTRTRELREMATPHQARISEGEEIYGY
jgi:hypothetical protein